MPPVGFKLCFTGTPCAYSSAEAGKACSLAAETRKRIFKLRQFNLQLALSAPRPCGKDIKYKLGAVDNSYPGYVLYISLLRGSKLRVKNEQIRLVVTAKILYLLQPATADIGGSIQLFTFLRDLCLNLGTRGFGELCKLAERFLAVKIARIHPHKESGFRLLCVFKKLSQNIPTLKLN